MSKSEQNRREEYLILQSTTASDIQRQVNEKIEDGYMTYGDLVGHSGYLLQVMRIDRSHETMMKLAGKGISEKIRNQVEGYRLPEDSFGESGTNLTEEFGKKCKNEKDKKK